MRKKSVLSAVLFLMAAVLFYKNNQIIIEKVQTFSNNIKTIFVTKKTKISDTISSHFRQKEQIELLRKQIKNLEEKASLSVAFASKMNSYLKLHTLSEYHPNLQLVQSLGYARMQDKNRLWIDFPSFDKEKNYGLIYQGYTAGIIREKFQKPLAILQTSKESLFSVFIGDKNIQGIAFGGDQYLKIKYIPSYENPHVGDEVITSGNDQIFYEGIKVGKVIAIEKLDMYKIATVRPYVDLNGAQFFYAVAVK